MEELTRKPSEARLRSLLDRKHDRKQKLDSLDKQIAAYEANLTTAKEQHDAFSKELDAIQIEVANVMKVLNISLEQAERIPEGLHAQDKEPAQEPPVVRSPSPNKRNAARMTPQGTGEDQGMRGAPTPSPATPIGRPPTANLMAPPSTNTLGGTTGREQSGSPGSPASAHDWGTKR